jgi:hypothetical protein
MPAIKVGAELREGQGGIRGVAGYSARSVSVYGIHRCFRCLRSYPYLLCLLTVFIDVFDACAVALTNIIKFSDDKVWIIMRVFYE